MNSRRSGLHHRGRPVSITSLTNVIAHLAMTGKPTLGRAAARTGLSTRSLQRELERQGVCYSDLVDEARYELAKSLLRGTTINISAIAKTLGYLDPSSFSRAFLRWSGKTPREYRSKRRRRSRVDH